MAMNQETTRNRGSGVTPRRQGILAALAALIVVLSGCGTGTAPTGAPPPAAATGAAVPTQIAAATSASTSAPPTTVVGAFARNPAPYVAGTAYAQSIDPADFVARVDHPFLPLAPGATFVFDGDEHVEIAVLTETKLILGVAATVVRDQVFIDGVLEEDTLDFYAQDRDGNVWYLGETTAEFGKDGKVTSTAGSWIGGVGGAYPGIVMLALPRTGDEYRQEYLAAEAEDLARITGLTGSVTVGAGSWAGGDVLVTEEWTPLEPGHRERKTYARGAGLVKTETILGGTAVTTLTSFAP